MEKREISFSFWPRTKAFWTRKSRCSLRIRMMISTLSTCLPFLIFSQAEPEQWSMNNELTIPLFRTTITSLSSRPILINIPAGLSYYRYLNHRHAVGASLQLGKRAYKSKPSNTSESIDMSWKEAWIQHRIEVTNPNIDRRLSVYINTSTGWISKDTRSSHSGDIVASYRSERVIFNGLFLELAPSLKMNITDYLGVKLITRIRYGYGETKRNVNSWSGIFDDDGKPLAYIRSKQVNGFITDYIPLDLSICWSF